MKRTICTILMAAATLGILAQSWPEVMTEAKPGTRWWWHGSAVDKENLQWLMQQYADHGIGAVEITPVDAIQGNQANNIPYLSDRWMEMLREVQQNGRQLGMEVGMATGTGWPFGGPWVPLEESACKVVCVESTFTGRHAQDLELATFYSNNDSLLFYGAKDYHVGNHEEFISCLHKLNGAPDLYQLYKKSRGYPCENYTGDKGV